MEDRYTFCDALKRFVGESGYSTGQLARLTGIPKATLANWLQGRVSQPRNVEDLLKLAAALHLDEAQASHLLQAADYPAVERLRCGRVEERYRALLVPWAAPGKKERRAPFQAIADLPYFVGRERELRALERALLSPQHAEIYVLQGMGGVGKTALAAHLAYRLRTHFRDGVLWASLGSADAMSILLTFARALGDDVGEFTDLASRSAVMREILADKQVLIVLDDARSSEEVRPLLPPSGPSAVIVTTRRRDLRISWGGECFELGPFNAQGDEALKLFSRIMGEERVRQERVQFVELADLLGHLPLAIAVAAGRLAYEGNWQTADLLHRLRVEQHRLDELVGEEKSVRLSFNLSFEALCPEQRRLFAALGALGGEDFSVQAAARAADLPVHVAADLLRKLFNLSLVQEGRSGRYQLHPLLRDYARERVEDETVFERAVTYYVDFAVAHEAVFDALDVEIDNVAEALATAYKRRMWPELIAGTNALSPYLATRGHYTAAHLHLTCAIEAARTLDDKGGLVRALHHHGQIARIRGDYDTASTHLQESLALAGERDEKKLVGAIISELVMVEQMRANYAQANAYFSDARTMIYAEEGPNQSHGILLALGLFKLMQGDCGVAESYLQPGLRLAQSAEDATGISALVMALGMTAYRQADYERAEASLSEALVRARDIGYGSVEATALIGLGLVAGRRGNYQQARSFFDEGLALSEAVGQSWAVGRLLNEWGDVCLGLDEAPAAAAAFSKALKMARETEAQALAGEALFGLARLAAGRGDYAEAGRLGGESSAILGELKHHRAAEVEGWVSRMAGREKA